MPTKHQLSAFGERALGQFALDIHYDASGSRIGMTISYSHSPALMIRLGAFRKRTELLVGTPSGITSTTNWIGAVMKFVFELGGEESKYQKRRISKYNAMFAIRTR